jgi:acyl-CoA reductase-like NAD-dependent aldehyde dehydrogenase
LLVHESIAPVLVSLIVRKTKALDLASDLGRISADKQRLVYKRHMDDAVERGLEIACGGCYAGPDTFAPTVVRGPGIEDSLVYQQESFGPIVAVRTFRSDDEAVAMHNALWGGLTASIFCGDSSRGEELAERLDAGLVSVNDVAATLHAIPELPWGGTGASGFGRSHGVEGLQEFTQSKVVDLPRAGGLDVKRPWWFPYDRTQTELMTSFARVVGARNLKARLGEAAKLGSAAIRLFSSRARL